MAQPARTPATRAPQARSLATRRRLLEAAISSLAELGHARTTTTEVCRRAGVSQGALFRHFPSKEALLGATARRLFATLFEEFRSAFADVAGQGDRLHAALGLLWQVFERPQLQAAFELYMAARSDAGLRRQLEPVVAEHRANLRAEARKLFPEAVGRRDFEGLVDVVVAAMQGAALGALVLPDPAGEIRGLAVLERMARRELEDV